MPFGLSRILPPAWLQSLANAPHVLRLAPCWESCRTTQPREIYEFTAWISDLENRDGIKT